MGERPNGRLHLRAQRSEARQVQARVGLPVDPAGSPISRACGFSSRPRSVAEMNHAITKAAFRQQLKLQADIVGD